MTNTSLTKKIIEVINSKPDKKKEKNHLVYLLGYSNVCILNSRLQKHNWTKSEVYYLEDFYLDKLNSALDGGGV